MMMHPIAIRESVIGSGEGCVVGMFVERTAIEDGIVGGTGDAGGLVTDGIFPLTRVNTKLP